jgi:hypothetical protein
MDTEGKNPKQSAARWAMAEKAATEKLYLPASETLQMEQ